MSEFTMTVWPVSGPAQEVTVSADNARHARRKVINRKAFKGALTSEPQEVTRVQAVEVTATSIADVPDAPCEKCGAPVEAYEKHPVLIGGTCNVCHEVWLPPITWGAPKAIEVDLKIVEEGNVVEASEMTDEEHEAIITAQIAYIEERFGKPAAEATNYGWGTTDEGVASKVYGHGVLSTDRALQHTFEPFEEQA